jgi:adenylate cyclase
MKYNQKDKPFPLKKYYIVYAGIGGIIFYSILFAFFIHAERQALYDQYVQNLTEKARALYQDIYRDFLKTQNITLEDIGTENNPYRKKLRDEIDGIIQTDFTLAKVKVFNKSGLVLYDYTNNSNEGKPYQSMHEIGFKTALQGKTSSKMEHENNSKRFMEVYLPIYAFDTNAVVGVLELYEDVSRFEKRVFIALKQALIVPTIIFVIFNITLFLIVAKADRIISLNTELLINIRRNMEKYLSPSATEAIYNAVTLKTELFRGEKQNIVIFFSDIRGFTNYSENNKPEIVVRALNDIFELQARIIHEHGGIIDKFIGDEIMSIFPSESVAEATLAALKIIKEIQHNPKIFFEVGIGIHVGDAVVGSIGTKNRRDYTAIGNTVNTCARLCSASDSGEIIISSNIFELLTDDINTQFSLKETLQLKGKTENIEAYSSIVPAI